MTAPVEAPERHEDGPTFDLGPIDAPAPRSTPEDFSEAPDAPYGINPNTGKPYTIPEEERLARGERLAQARAAAAAKRAGGSPFSPPPKKATGGQAPKKATGPDYRPAVAGLLQVPAFALAMVGRNNATLQADGVAVAMHTPAIADAAHQTAVNDPRFAAVLDRILKVGPYGALLGAVLPLVLQLAANHGLVAANPEVGILTVEQLLAQAA